MIRIMNSEPSILAEMLNGKNNLSLLIKTVTKKWQTAGSQGGQQKAQWSSLGNLYPLSFIFIYIFNGYYILEHKGIKFP